MPENDLKKRRKPQQKRSKKKFDQIIDSTARIISEEGFQGLTTNRIAKESNVGIATLYGYFDNREDILDALLQREMKAILALVEQQAVATLNSPPAQAFEALYRLVIEHLISVAPLVRAYSGYISPNSQNPVTTNFYTQIELLLRLLISNYTGKSPNEAKRDAYLASRALAGVAISVATEEPPKISVSDAVSRAVEITLLLISETAQSNLRKG